MAFYLTLPSNSSSKFFPDNHAGHFITQLPNEIDLNGHWEVGLAEIQFTNKYLNVTGKDLWMKYTTPDLKSQMEAPIRINPEEATSGSGSYRPPSVITLDINEGLYATNEQFIRELNRAAEQQLLYLSTKRRKREPPLKFEYNTNSKKAVIIMEEKGSILELGPGIKRILGTEWFLYQGKTTARCPRMMDVNQSFKSIFVYCDLASPRPVGDAMAPLLRVLPIIQRDDETETYHQIYPKPHYMPLGRSQFHSIEMVLSADTGKTLSFSSGHTVATLHLRPRQPYLV